MERLENLTAVLIRAELAESVEDLLQDRGQPAGVAR